MRTYACTLTFLLTLQVATLIPEVYLVQMPAQVDDFLEFFRLAIELAAWNVHISCYGDSGVKAQLEFLIQWPLIAIAATPLVGLLLALLFKHTTPEEIWALATTQSWTMW